MGWKRRPSLICFSLLITTICCLFPAPAVHAEAEGPDGAGQEAAASPLVPLIRKEQRRRLTTTESGVVSAVDVPDGVRGPYHLQFFSLEPDSMFLPVFLHTDMVFYVDTGKGLMSWIESDDTKTINMEIERGDVYQISTGSVFYIRSHSDPMREKLRITAMFASSKQEQSQEGDGFPYTHLSDLIRGFDEEILQKGFNISEEVVQGIKGSLEQPAPMIISYPKHNTTATHHHADSFNGIELVTRRASRSLGVLAASTNKKKAKPFNVFKEKPDIKNEFGWSTTVTKKDLSVLKESDIGVFVVNLTGGSMMGPHWNPMATEIAVALQGQGMVQVVNPALPSGPAAYPTGVSSRLHVEAGDVFTVPRYHPVAQMAFNTSSFVFTGFTMSSRRNWPQFLAGKKSVLHALDRDVLAMSFDVPNTTVRDLLAAQNEAIILSCPACAEVMEQQRMEREAEEAAAAARREEEERRRQQEEEERRAQQAEEEERRQQEEEEARRQQEEEQRRRQQQEEEERRRKQQEEEMRRQQEEEMRRQQQEEDARRAEEERRQQQEEEMTRQQEQAMRWQQQEEKARRAEEQRRQQQEEEMRRQQEEEMRRQQQEEESRRAEEERQRQEEEMRRQQEEEMRRQKQEEESRRAEEVRRQQEEEEAMREEERRWQEEQQAAQQQEEARREEEQRRQQEEAAMREQEEQQQRWSQEEQEARMEEEERRRREEEMAGGGGGAERFRGGQQGEEGGGWGQGEGEPQPWGGEQEGGQEGWGQGGGEQQPWGGEGRGSGGGQGWEQQGGGGGWGQPEGEQQAWGGQGAGWGQGQGEQWQPGSQGGGRWEEEQGQGGEWLLRAKTKEEITAT